MVYWEINEILNKLEVAWPIFWTLLLAKLVDDWLTLGLALVCVLTINNTQSDQALRPYNR
jgi:hypothetical protein